MNILGIFLNRELRTGGHIRCLELMEGLGQRGHSVTVLLNRTLVYDPKCFVAVRIRADYRRGQFPRTSVAFKRSTNDFLHKRTLSPKPDLVLAFGETHFPAARMAGKTFGVPVVLGYQSNSVQEALISIRENAFRVHKALMSFFTLLRSRLYEIRITQSKCALIFQSTFDRADFVSRNPNAADRSFVIGGNIGPPRFSLDTRGLNKEDSLRKILFMGTLGERKGLRYLLEAFKSVISNRPERVELHVAGPGTPKELDYFRRYSLRNGFSQLVRFYGRVSDVFPLMSECDLMVVPSLFDSYPDVVLLALHVGIPVVGSRVGGIPEMLKHQDLLFPPRDSAAIASILERCLDDPSYYRTLRALSAQRREPFLFDWPAAWERVVMKVIGR